MLRIIFLCTLLFLLTGCGGSDPLDLFAESFTGGQLSGFSGAGSSDPNGRATAEELTEERSFDLTPGGFEIESGTISSEPPAGSQFGVGSGSLNVDGNTGTLELGIVSADPNVTDAQLSGTFDLDEASAALINPQSTFDMRWDISFSYLGIPLNLQATQEMSGADFRQQ
jgi:hypothetical protein